MSAPTAVEPRVEELADYGELAGLVDQKFLPPAEVSRCFVYRGGDGQIEGYCFIQPIIVIEPLWVTPAKRRRGVAPKLFDQAVRALMTEGTAAGFYCRAETPEVEGYLKRLGMKEAGKAFVMELGKHL